MSLKILETIADKICDLKISYEAWWDEQPENVCNRENTIWELKDASDYYSVEDGEIFISTIVFCIFLAMVGVMIIACLLYAIGLFVNF